MDRRDWIGAVASLLSAIAVATAGALALGDEPAVLLTTSGGTLAVLLLPYFAFAFTSFGERLAQALKKAPSRVWLYGLGLVASYFLYALPTGVFYWGAAGKLLLFICLPSLCCWLAHRSGRALSLWDAAAVVAIWLPFDFRWLGSIWTWPVGEGSYVFNTVIAVDLALLLLLGFRRIDDIGYPWQCNRRLPMEVMVHFVVFSAVAIPLGTANGFIAFQPRASGPMELVGSSLAIFLFVAIPEELLFRGLIQNFLAKTLGPGFRSLVPAALVFGAAHLNNATGGGDLPNWSYFVLASIAGLFYGSAFIRTRGLVAPAIVHTLVDVVWRELFR